jgi:hypothetical protein
VACQSTEGKGCGYVGGAQGAERISQGGRVIGEDGHERRAELETTTIMNSLTAHSILFGRLEIDTCLHGAYPNA